MINVNLSFFTDIQDVHGQEATTVAAEELDGDLDETLDAPETMQMELEGKNKMSSKNLLMF